MPFFDYICKCGAKRPDELVKAFDEVIYCPRCRKEMDKQVSAPALMGFDKFGTSKKTTK